MTFKWPKNAIKSREEFINIGVENIWVVDWDGKVYKWTGLWDSRDPVPSWFFEGERDPYVFLFGNYWDAYAHILKVRRKENEPEVGA